MHPEDLGTPPPPTPVHPHLQLACLNESQTQYRLREVWSGCLNWKGCNFFSLYFCCIFLQRSLGAPRPHWPQGHRPLPYRSPISFYICQLIKTGFPPSLCVSVRHAAYVQTPVAPVTLCHGDWRPVLWCDCQVNLSVNRHSTHLTPWDLTTPTWSSVAVVWMFSALYEWCCSSGIAIHVLGLMLFLGNVEIYLLPL